MANWDLSAKDGRVSVAFSQGQKEAFENVLETIAPATVSRLKNLTQTLKENSESLWPVAHPYKTERERKDGSTYEVLIMRRSKGSRGKHVTGIKMSASTRILGFLKNTASYSYNIKTGEPQQPLSQIVPMGKRVSQFLIFSPGRKKKTVNQLADALADDLAKSAVSDRPITRFKAIFKQGRELL